MEAYCILAGKIIMFCHSNNKFLALSCLFFFFSYSKTNYFGVVTRSSLSIKLLTAAKNTSSKFKKCYLKHCTIMRKRSCCNKNKTR